MKKLLAVCAIAALAACSSEPADETPAANDEVAVEEPASTMAGTYTGTDDDGEWTSVLNADGTYEDSRGGEVNESGTWAEVGGKTCFYPTVEEGAEAKETCYTTTEPNEVGVMTVTNDEGESQEITKTL